MAIHVGWAYTSNEDAAHKENLEEYNKIAHLRAPEHMELSKLPQYAHVRFNGKLLSEEAKALTTQQLLLLADAGNLCFGGSCQKNGDTFSGRYNTD